MFVMSWVFSLYRSPLLLWSRFSVVSVGWRGVRVQSFIIVDLRQLMGMMHQ